LRADEKRIRTQSAILDKTRSPCLPLTVTVVLVREFLIRTKNMVGARSAQVR
jgi:hypothetical protein